MRKISEPGFELTVDICEVYFQGRTGKFLMRQVDSDGIHYDGDDSAISELYSLLSRRIDLRTFRQYEPNFELDLVEGTPPKHAELYPKIIAIGEWLIGNSPVM